MAELLTRPLLRRDEPAWGSRVPWLAGVLASAWSLVAGLALCAVPAVAVWIGDRATGSVADPLRLGARVWLVAHRAGLDVGAASFTVAPLGLTVLVALLLYRSARWAAHSAGVSTPRAAVAVTAPAALAYMLGGGLLAGVSATAGVGAGVVPAVLWPGFWAASATALGVAVEAGLIGAWLDRTAPGVRATLAGAAVAFAGVAAGGALMVVVSSMANADRVGQLAEAIDAGVLGTIVLALGSAVFVPNAIAWAGAFVLGPGFALGAGTSVAPGGVELGIVPALPALGALPEAMPGPLTWAVLALPVAAGVLAGVVVHRRLAEGGVPPAGDAAPSEGAIALGERRAALATAAVAAFGAGMVATFGLALTAYLAGGSAGAARLTQVGAVPGEVTLAALGLVVLPAVVTSVVLCGRAPAAGPGDTAAPQEAPVAPATEQPDAAGDGNGDGGVNGGATAGR